MIEHLPQELRDRFTEMRELDLTVQNSMDSLEKKARTFFLQCKRGELQSTAAEIEFQNLRKEYYKVLEDADEKVAIATQIHDLVERYLRRLDSELFKFKCELEADNNGITEILEKRSLELDGSSSLSSNIGNQKENRYFGALTTNNHTASTLAAVPASQPKDNRFRQKPEKRRDSTPAPVVEKRPNLGNTIPATAVPVAQNVVQAVTPNVTHHAVIPPATGGPSVSYNLQHMGGAGNAIAAAASQAIVATQQMQQGRRTASLKASYEAIHGAAGGATPHEFWINRDINTPSGQNTLQVDRESSARKHKKKISSHLPQNTPTTPTPIPSSSSSISSHAESSTSSIAEVIPSPAAVNAVATTSAAAAAAAAAVQRNNSVSVDSNSLVVEQTTEGEWSYDPNEPRYCICNQVSYGDMVACDNDACPFEWFHYPCVGITQPPKGKWYCPKCTASMRRRGNRKN